MNITPEMVYGTFIVALVSVLLKRLHWIMIFLSLIVATGIVYINIPSCRFGWGDWTNFNIWLLITMLISTSVVIYPKSGYNSWAIKSLSGLFLLFIPSFYIATLFSLFWYKQRIMASFVIIGIFFIVIIFLSYFIRRKIQQGFTRTNQILKILFAVLLFVSLFFLLLYFCDLFYRQIFYGTIFGQIFSFALFLFLSILFVLLYLSIPALINAGGLTRKWISLAYASIILAQLSLLVFYPLVYNSFCGE